jgi:hypothetical protein
MWLCKYVRGCPVIEIRYFYGGPTKYVSSPPLHLRVETDPVSETTRFYSQEHWTMEKKSKIPVILDYIYLFDTKLDFKI